MELGVYSDGLIYDNIKDELNYFFIDNCRIEFLKKLLSEKNTPNFSSNFSFNILRRNISKDEFINIVNIAKELILKGDIFQVVLSKKIFLQVKGDHLKIYESLRKVNPSPYMFCLKLYDRWIMGSSPEMLIRVTRDHVKTFPIAGTRKISNDESENLRLRNELENDEKELAEHTMLVDLSRNDMGKICKFGSVTVNDLMKIKRFSHVQHIVSEVRGILNEGESSFSALSALFPAGTVSGAPKIRAMEIIYELEPSSRGPYAGSVGYFSFNGSCDFAITIRSIFINRNKGFIQSGAGIVIDSVPAKEWEETEQKANALIEALELASECNDYDDIKR